jgi:MerR family copper efflux transcriptional regulator
VQHLHSLHWQVPQEQQLQPADWFDGSTCSTWLAEPGTFWDESSEMFMRFSYLVAATCRIGEDQASHRVRVNRAARVGGQMRGQLPPRPELAEARRKGLHNIGETSAVTGVSAKMIRHYESIGLIPKANRTFAGYRLYADADLHRLQFIKRCRGLGFSMKQIGVLLNLWNDKNRASREVKRLAQEHSDDLAQKVLEMQAMQRTLEALARNCHGDQRPDCPILDDLATR